MSNAKRGTRMYISTEELRKRTRQEINGSLLPIHEEVPLYAESNTTVTTDTERLDQIKLKDAFQGNQRGLYKDRYKGNVVLLDLGGEVNVVLKKGTSEIFTARRLYKDKTNSFELRHENLITAIEVFTEGNTVYVVAENMRLSLSQILKSPPFPTAEEIGTIMGQILDGLVYLQEKGFCHGALSCVDVLVNESGNVKLTTHRTFTRISPDAIEQDKQGVREICMMLMQKFTLPKKKVGVQDPERWKNSPQIIPFLSSATSCHRATELRQHPFISCLWGPESGWPRNILCELIQTTILTVPRYFRHSEETVLNVN